MNLRQASRAVPWWLGLLVVWLFVVENAGAVLPATATGANVDESRVQKTFYVDPAHTEAADDDKHGVPDAPFATLGFACQVAVKAKDANVGVKIVLAAGTYRESVEIHPPGHGAADSDAPLVIEAAEREQAVIDGADTEGWSPSTWKIEGTRWTHPWPFHHGTPLPHRGKPPVETPGESYRRGDLMFVNGTILRQVDDPALLATDGTWGVLAANPGGKKGSAKTEDLAVVQPPPETELPGSIIQVGMRRRGLTITGRRNVVVRGLLIQHAAEPGGTGEKTAGLVLEACSNVLVEDVLSQWNDGVGLAIQGGTGASPSADFTLCRVRLLHNGGSGLSVSGVKNLLAEDSETSFNNFRGDWAGWIDPQGPAGLQVEKVHVSTWRRQHVIGNPCRGAWWAGGNADVTIEDAVVRDNFVSGVTLENDPGPVLVRRCLVAGTKGHPSVPDPPAFSAGLVLTGTPDVTLKSNVFADNATSQLGLGNPSGTPSPRSERHVYRHNVFYSADAGTSLCRIPASEGDTKDRFGFYFATLDSKENCFWNPAKAAGFESYLYHPANRKTSAFYTAHSSTLAEWQVSVSTESVSKVEVDSLWQDPLFMDSTEGDYRLKKSSPVAEWDLPSNEAAAGQ